MAFVADRVTLPLDRCVLQEDHPCGEATEESAPQFGFFSVNTGRVMSRAGGSLSLAPRSQALNLLGSMKACRTSASSEEDHRATAIDQSESISTQVVARILLVSPNLIHCVSIVQSRTLSDLLDPTGCLCQCVGEKRDARTVANVHEILADRADAQHSVALRYKEAMLDGVEGLSVFEPSGD